MVNDTISSKIKPSSQALHPIEAVYFYQSHLKGKQDYGHQVVAVLLACNGLVLSYAFVLYDKSISKIEIVENIAKELPVPPVLSYFLCDSWYTSKTIIHAFGNSKALRVFISTNVSLSNKEILDSYVEHWSIEVSFREGKDKLGLDSYPIRSANGIQRYWLLMSLAYFICCTSIANGTSFTDGYHAIRTIIHEEKIQYIFQYAKSGGNFDELLKMIG